MANKEVIDYLREGRKRGFSFQILKQKLLENGFSDREIEEAISLVNGGQQIQVPQQRPVQQITQVSSTQITNQYAESGKFGLFKKIGKAVTNPSELFEKTNEEGIWPPVKYQLILSIVLFVVGSVFLLFFFDFFSSATFGAIENLPGAGDKLLGQTTEDKLKLTGSWFGIVFPGGLILAFVLNGILHLIMKIYNGQGSYSNTFKTGVYSSIPIFLFGGFPYVNFATVLWTFVLMIFGLGVNHRISKVRAFFSLFSIILFFTVVWLAFYAIRLYSN